VIPQKAKESRKVDHNKNKAGEKWVYFTLPIEMLIPKFNSPTKINPCLLPGEISFFSRFLAEDLEKSRLRLDF
jgi:hypothetical protein